MPSDSFDIVKIALLARLKLTAEEQTRLSRQFESILNYIDQLNQLDTENVEPTSHVLSLQNVFREDKVKPVFGDGKYLPLAPRQDKDHYEVPKII